MPIQPFLLDFGPGIQRDGTRFDATRYLDALWCRWRLGRPRKMGGYKLITGKLNGLPRRIHGFYQGSQIIWHVGTANGLQQVITDRFGNLISITDRTPTAFAGGIDVGWTLDALYDTTSKVVQIIAHAVPDESYLASTLQTVPFLGQIDLATPLIEFSNPGVIPSGTWI